eukprot:3939552-Rhodomonas_salina.2
MALPDCSGTSLLVGDHGLRLASALELLAPAQMSGTDLVYGSRCPVLTSYMLLPGDITFYAHALSSVELSGRLPPLRACYAPSGTHITYPLCSPISPRACYALSDTHLACPTCCPVLTLCILFAVQYACSVSHVLSGTQMAYPMRCPVLT